MNRENGSSCDWAASTATTRRKRAAHQEGLRGLLAATDGGGRVLVEVGEVPLVGRLDDTVEGDEKLLTIPS
jgi:hypothetical protein